MKNKITINNLARPKISTAIAQDGFVLITVLIVVLIVGIITTSMLDTSERSQQVSSATIQRNRVFQAIDTALEVAEKELLDSSRERRFSDASATDGVYSYKARDGRWWKQTDYAGESPIAEDKVLGVISPPRYTLEQIGQYVSDGGTGIVGLNTGSGAYGRKSNGVREVVLYSVEAYGNGSYPSVQAAAESIVILNQ